MGYIGAGITRFNTADELTVTGDAQIDTTTLVVDSTNNRVGIGTSSPDERLHVLAGSAGSVTASSNADLVVENSANSGLNILTPNNQNGQILFGDPEDNDIGRLQYNHASNYMAFYTNANERVRIDSSGRVGIGGTPTLRNLEVIDTNPVIAILSDTTTDASQLMFGDSADDNVGRIFYDHTNDFMRFDTGASEAMRIDSSGNLLVGTTNANPAENNVAGIGALANNTLSITRDGNAAMQLNRKTSDGSIAIFRKDGSTVGSIGNNGDNLGIESVDVGLLFLSGSNEIVPTGGNFGVSDGTKDLGRSATRFKDLYLSGSAQLANITNGAGEKLILNSDNMAFQVQASEAMRIDSSGHLLVGTTSTNAIGSLNAQLQVEGTSAATSAISVTRNTADNNPPYLLFGKSRGTSDGSNTAVQENDFLGSITWSGADGTDKSNEAAAIIAQVDGTPGSNDMPGRLVFKTTSDGGGSSTERMRIRQGGQVNIASTGNPSGASDATKLTVVQSSGTDAVFIDRTADIDSNYRDLVRFARNGTTVGQIKARNNAVQYNTSSDARLKENVEDMTGAIDRVKTLKPKRFSWIVDDIDAPNIDG